MIAVETYTLPAFWAGYLINGDASGLKDAEARKVDAWVANRNLGPCLSCSSEPYFSWLNDANSLGGDVLEYEFTIL